MGFSSRVLVGAAAVAGGGERDEQRGTKGKGTATLLLLLVDPVT